MPQMTDQVTHTHAQSHTRQAHSTYSIIECIGLLCLALAVTASMLSVWLLHGTFVPEFFLIIVPAVLLSGLVIKRVRWTEVAGAIVALLTVALFLTDPNVQETLVHPGESFLDFSAEVLVLASALVVTVVGVTAPLQTAWGRWIVDQRWLRAFLTGLTGVVVGMLVVAALAAVNPVATSASSTSNGEPRVQMTTDHFAQNVVLVPKGSRLLIVSGSSVEHILRNGMWTPSGTPETLTESGAPAVHDLTIKGGSVQIGPFTTAGIFHLYCTIHRGMNLIIVVQ